MKEILLLLQRRGFFILIFLANLFLSFHYFTSAYVGSSFLGGFVSEAMVGLFYVISALLNIILFILAPGILRRIGNYKFTLIIGAIGLISVLAISLKPPVILAIILFVIFQAVAPTILYNLDIFLEHGTKDEAVTGRVRSIFLTMANIAVVISPLILSLLDISSDDFSEAFLISGMFLIPLLTIISLSFHSFKDPTYLNINYKRDWRIFVENKDTRATVIADFLLQFIYSWLVIYVPIYATKVLGFTWHEFGIMLSIALLPYLIIQLPAGFMADRFWGEKEMLGAGFVIMAVSVFLLPAVKTADFVLVTALFFAIRVGAALTEISVESHFFKKTDGEDSDMISIFRSARPLAYVLAPAIGVPLIALGGFTLLFVFLASLMVIGFITTTEIVDTL